MSKQASGYERAGMFREAAELYYQASLRKPKKIDYKMGLNRAGQMYMEGLASDVSRAYSRGEYRKAVYDYLEMKAFADKVQRTGVTLRIEHSTQRTFENAREIYLDERYELGQRLIGEQNFDEARKIFVEIHGISPNFRDTRSYLNTATLEPMYQNGARFFSQRNYMQAYVEWERIAAKDPGYKDVRQRMQQALNERYKEGTLFLLNEDFTAAARALGDVYKVNPGYMDVKSQYIEARNEPVYRASIQNLGSGRCRAAFRGFEQIIADAGGNYKNAVSLRNEAIVCASYPIALLSNPMPGNHADGEEFENILIQMILDTKDPFIKIHKLADINQRVLRAFQGTTGSLNRTMLRQLYDRNGIAAVLVLNFSQYQKTAGSLQRAEKTGFERVVIENREGETSYRDQQVSYMEYSRTNQVQINVNVQLVSTLTGEILLSRRYSQTESDEMKYAVYRGESKNLYPATLRNNSYHIDERNYASLQRLLNADQTITSPNQLRDKLFSDLNINITQALITFDPER
ncbi:MAG: hypothetical protein EA361_17680 [Bacteroidetes bacterium]|nr:MAG: hypothetical protein EA361_17680 [Bacteroidota bacterium]